MIGIVVSACIGTLLLLVVVVVGSMVLRVACWMCGVKEPGKFRAMGVVLLTYLATYGLSIGVGFGVALSETLTGVETGRAGVALRVAAAVVSLPLGALISAALYTALLDNVTFGKGLLLWLAQIGIGLVIGLGVAALVAAILVVTSAGSGPL